MPCLLAVQMPCLLDLLRDERIDQRSLLVDQLFLSGSHDTSNANKKGQGFSTDGCDKQQGGMSSDEEEVWNPASKYEEETVVDGLTLFEVEREPRAIVKTGTTTIAIRSLNADITCPICLGIMHGTHVVKHCLHRFCGPCIQKCLRLGKMECPSCRVRIGTKRELMPDRNVDELIARLYPDLDAYEEREQKIIEDINRKHNINNSFTQACHTRLLEQKQISKVPRGPRSSATARASSPPPAAAGSFSPVRTGAPASRYGAGGGGGGRSAANGSALRDGGGGGGSSAAGAADAGAGGTVPAATRASTRLASGAIKRERRSLSPPPPLSQPRTAARKRSKVSPSASDGRASNGRGRGASSSSSSSSAASSSSSAASSSSSSGANALLDFGAGAGGASAAAATDGINTVRFVLRRHPHEASVGRLQREYLRTSAELNVYHMKKFLGKKLSHKQFREFEVSGACLG